MASAMITKSADKLVKQAPWNFLEGCDAKKCEHCKHSFIIISAYRGRNGKSPGKYSTSVMDHCPWCGKKTY